jgi:hypothetical protein
MIRRFRFSLSAKDVVGGDIIPEQYWEIMRSAQIEQDGVHGDKYFGGLASSIEFSYAYSTGVSSLSQHSNLWYFPEPNDGQCHVADSGVSFSYTSFISTRINTGTVPSGSGADSMDYLNTHWYVVDSDLVAYGRFWCDAASGSDYLDNSTLPDGSYVFRSTGAYDSLAGSYSWSFRGRTGAGEHELQFHIASGVCYADVLASNNNICDGATAYSINQELECSSTFESTIPQPTLANFESDNKTCLYVNVVDQFGDGWDSSVVFNYWVEVDGFDSNVISMTLNCTCPQRVRGVCFPAISS